MSREKYFRNIEELLNDFCIPLTESLETYIKDTYPNEIAIDNHIQSLISKKLSDD